MPRRNPFDHLAKEIGLTVLGASGPTVAHHEIWAEPQHADLRHDPDPTRADERAQLGLLGRMASGICLIEVFSRAPSAAEFRGCVAKHVAFWRKLVRDARRLGQRPAAIPPPSLWIIAASTPRSLVARLGLVEAPGWPTGTYFFGAEVLRVGVISASLLPRTRETVLVRLMAAPRSSSDALVDLLQLPPSAYERVAVEHLLVELPNPLDERSGVNVEEHVEPKITMVELLGGALIHGRTQGQLEGHAQALLTVLRVRGIPVRRMDRARIEEEADCRQLKTWLKRATVATSLDQVLVEPLEDDEEFTPAAPRRRRAGRRAAGAAGS